MFTVSRGPVIEFCYTAQLKNKARKKEKRKKKKTTKKKFCLGFKEHNLIMCKLKVKVFVSQES